MKTLRGKDPFHFIRYGGLNLIKQKGYSSKGYPDKGWHFHCPPAPRGFYAFPRVAVELFLISSISERDEKGQFVKHENTFTKDENGKLIELRTNKHVYDNIRKTFYKDKGTVWHHLEDLVKPNEILASHHTWVKTSMKDWAKALGKASVMLRADAKYKHQMVSSHLFGGYSMDTLEVFFDEKV